MSIVAQFVKVELRIVMPGTWAMMHSLCTPSPTWRTSWNTTSSITRCVLAASSEPASIAPFSSTTLPTRLCRSVTLRAPPCSNTAPSVLVPPASRSSRSKVMSSASLWSWRIVLPARPRKVTRLDPSGTVCAP